MWPSDNLPAERLYPHVSQLAVAVHEGLLAWAQSRLRMAGQETVEVYGQFPALGTGAAHVVLFPFQIGPDPKLVESLATGTMLGPQRVDAGGGLARPLAELGRVLTEALAATLPAGPMLPTPLERLPASLRAWFVERRSTPWVVADDEGERARLPSLVWRPGIGLSFRYLAVAGEPGRGVSERTSVAAPVSVRALSVLSAATHLERLYETMLPPQYLPDELASYVEALADAAPEPFGERLRVLLAEARAPQRAAVAIHPVGDLSPDTFIQLMQAMQRPLQAALVLQVRLSVGAFASFEPAAQVQLHVRPAGRWAVPGLLVSCYEPEARPPRATREVGSGGATLWLLKRTSNALRATVLRGRDEAPPPDGLRLCDIDVGLTPAGAGVGRARAADARVELAVFRGETRARVAHDADIKGPTRFEAALPDGAVVSFALEAASPSRQGARATVGSGRTRSLDARSLGMRAMWVVPSAWDLLMDPKSRIDAMVFKKLPAWMRSRAFALALVVLCAALASVGISLELGARAKEADDARGAAEERADASDANLSAALVAESTCTDDRLVLADRLSDVEAARAARIDRALALGASRSRAIAAGGARMRSPELLMVDAAATNALRAAVGRLLARLEATPTPDASRCLEQAALLGDTLPRFTLLWHGEPDRVCTGDYAEIVQGVDRAGRWGLARRAAFEVGQPVETGDATLGVSPPDPRQNTIWSATALTTGVRAVEAGLLAANTGSRPAVAPSQLHLWALAVWTAYNRMPTGAEGVLDEPLARCVAGLLEQRQSDRSAPRPGAPVLPDLTEAATLPPPTPTAGCPWPADAIEVGAERALQSVAYAAWLDDAAPTTEAP